MVNVKLSFHNKMPSLQTALEMTVDGRVYRVESGAPADIGLGDGIHTVSASVDFQGNRITTASAPLEVKSGMCYRVAYTAAGMAAGTITVHEVSPILFNDGVAAVRPKKRKTGPVAVMFISVIAVFALIGGVFYAFMATSKITDSTGSSDNTGWFTNYTVTQLNAPCTVADNLVTFTDVTAAPLEDGSGKMVVIIGVTLKNISTDHTVNVRPRWKGYVDDLSVSVSDAGTQYLQTGTLSPGKYTSGCCGFNTAKDARHFELVMSLDSGDTVTFSYDIPTIQTTDQGPINNTVS